MRAADLYVLQGIKRTVKRDMVILAVDHLVIPEGIMTAIVGPNGSGKSTLLKLLAFLEETDKGEMFFRGRKVNQKNFFDFRRVVTMVGQAPLLFRGTVFKNVAYGLKVRGVPSSKWKALVGEALSLVDLAGFENRSVKGLSGGEIQRVAIARALVFKPEVILLDEPTAGVDVARMEMVEALIKELNSSMGVSIIFSTHNLAQAYRLTDRVLHMSAGCIARSSIENLFSGHTETVGNSCFVQLKGGPRIKIGEVRTGLIRFTIPSSCIEIRPSTEGGDQVNRFEGIITRLELRGSRARLRLNGKLNLRIEVAPDELEQKGLTLGRRVTAIVPPTAVQILDGA